ncbi:MAG: L-threonylcarbamoyladenylate synthase, partial [Candidatus Gracilibacteria bacterium]
MKNVKVKDVVKILESGGVVMHPTETCYGLAVDVMNEGGLKKLYEVKGRDFNKPVSMFVADLEMAQKYGVFSEKALELAKKYWPGALSIVVPRTWELPAFFNKGEKFVSMRVSGDEFCREMVKELGRPVTTTSANMAGEPELYEAKALEGVDLVVDGGKIEMRKPSTI